MPQTRRDFIKTTINASAAGTFALRGGAPLFASTSGQSTAGQASAGKRTRQRRPNILLLFPDQWRFDWMSSNPDLPIKTPNLDRLARTGMRFTNIIVGTPLCAPSRACLASGMEYGKTQVPSNQYDYPVGKLKTFYSMLRESGYHVLGCGKLDLAKVSNWWGIDGKWRLPSLGFSDGINNAGKIDQLIGFRLNNNQPADPYMTYLTSKGLVQGRLDDIVKRMKGGYAATYPELLPDEAYCDNWLVKNGLDLLDAAPKDKPWFLQVNWTGPHNPVDITASMESKVRGLKMPPPNGKNQYTLPVNQRIRQNYTAMCQNIDRGIGLYLDKLASRGELENTLIVFSSDHGEMLGDHGRWGKIVPYQPSASVPLTVAGPGIQQGVTSRALVSLIDLTATFLDYADVPRPATMDSQSFRPVLEGKQKAHREVLFSALGGWQMLFDGQYKVIRGFNPQDSRNSPEWTVYSKEVQGLPPLVFDLVHDPGENTNLAAAMPSGAQRLLEMLPVAGCA